jgi:glycosyltransferase involved in cell wall biosynthesis
MGAAVRLAVVIPAWNEADRFDPVAVHRFLEAHPGGELVLVNDGSTDGTAALFDELAARAPSQVQVLHLATNVGKGEAVRRGLLHAFDRGAELAAYLDADLAAPLDTAMLLAAELQHRERVHLVIGSRVKLLGWEIERSAWRHYPGRVFATFASITLGLPVYDTQCGAKCLRNGEAVRTALARPFQSRWLFDVELIARVRDALGPAGLREMPIPEWADRGGSSVRFRDFLRAPWELWKVRRRYPPGPR